MIIAVLRALIYSQPVVAHRQAQVVGVVALARPGELLQPLAWAIGKAIRFVCLSKAAQARCEMYAHAYIPRYIIATLIYLPLVPFLFYHDFALLSRSHGTSRI
jgi:hypothetical protein